MFYSDFLQFHIPVRLTQGLNMQTPHQNGLLDQTHFILWLLWFVISNNSTIVKSLDKTSGSYFSLFHVILLEFEENNIMKTFGPLTVWKIKDDLVCDGLLQLDRAKFGISLLWGW